MLPFSFILKFNDLQLNLWKKKIKFPPSCSCNHINFLSKMNLFYLVLSLDAYFLLSPLRRFTSGFFT